MATVMVGFSFVFALIYLFLVCDGFLLDDRTKLATTSGPLLSDQHYNNLLNLIMTERQTRANLAQHVVRLEQELVATQQGVTDIYHTSADNNVTLEREARNWNILSAKYNNLDTDHNLLKLKFDKLDTKHSNLENYTKVLEEKVASLQQLKGVTDLQTVLSVRNETKILREELRNTNNSVNSLRNEAEARKQDFVALLNKANYTENKMGYSVKTLNDKIENQQNQTKLDMNLMQAEMQRLGTYQNQTFKHVYENLAVVDGVQKLSDEKLDLEIHNMSNRAALTVCAQGKTYAGSIIRFPEVKTSYGVSSSTIYRLRYFGEFRHRKAGFYLISAYLMTNSSGYMEFLLRKNKQIVSSFISPEITTAYKYRTSSFLTLQYLNINDFLDIRSLTSAYIYKGYHSCLSILQLSNG